jgi:hypothetical protein
MGYPQMMHPAYHPPYHGFCHSCCHPVSSCVCGWRECRKEAKELLVKPQEDTKEGAARLNALFTVARAPGFVAREPPEEAEGIPTTDPAALGRFAIVDGGITVDQRAVGTGEAFIGGGCCVHLSIEYTSASATSAVAVIVTDSEGTLLGWAKAGMKPGYYVKEDIISTKPGAKLQVTVMGAIARVRWCEVFSC